VKDFAAPLVELDASWTCNNRFWHLSPGDIDSQGEAPLVNNMKLLEPKVLPPESIDSDTTAHRHGVIAISA
jgi:hypothetical protein